MEVGTRPSTIPPTSQRVPHFMFQINPAVSTLNKIRPSNILIFPISINRDDEFVLLEMATSVSLVSSMMSADGHFLRY